MDCIKISVIIPVYKVEKYLTKCLESVIRQTYPFLDIILIDDGSPDCCGAICDAYMTKDSRIRAFHIENQGLSGARNYGISKAMESDSKYIVFIDSDDWVEENMLEILIKEAEEIQADIVNCGFYYEYKNYKIKASVIDKTFIDGIEVVRSLIFGYFYNAVWNKLWKKALFMYVNFPLGHLFEDVATNYKIFVNVNKVVSISTPLYHYRQRKNSILHSYSGKNLVDYWLANKERYEYFLRKEVFKTDKVLLQKLLYDSAFAILRTWRWWYATSEKDKVQYSFQLHEMRKFTKRHFPLLGDKQWPLSLRLNIFLSRFNNKAVFAVLYYLNQAYRWVKKRKI